MKAVQATRAVEVQGPLAGRHADILSPEALAFLVDLHRSFEPKRRGLLDARIRTQARLDAGERPSFHRETRDVRDATWIVGATPEDLSARHVEITGPTDRKMMINALNSGANVFMADFEDANTPHWGNLLDGQVNLHDAVRRKLLFSAPDGREYRLNSKTATLVVRPRGWHLDERHLQVDGAPISGSLFDFGLYFFHNARELTSRGTGPYFYLPKLENHGEAALWNEVFDYSEQRLNIPRYRTKATVLVETVLAAFEMEEILFALRNHVVGLNAGRWDYIFSILKKFRMANELPLADRSEITMTLPFMKAYTDLLVQTCHRRDAHAIGGMAAYIPNRRDAEANERALGLVREDKLREVRAGFDGTWVAHPDLVPVAQVAFKEHLHTWPHQLERTRDDVSVTPGHLLDFRLPAARMTEEGLRSNVRVCLKYFDSWLQGVGAVAIDNLMEDAATAEIARSLLWHAQTRSLRLADGRVADAALIRGLARQEWSHLKTATSSENGSSPELFDDLALGTPFLDFFPKHAYERIL